MAKYANQAVVIQHVAFEDLGSLEPALVAAGYEIKALQAGVDDLGAYDAAAPDLLVVLGGPIGVYEQDNYPFLAHEIAMLSARLSARRPTLGICLGAQLMAAALGARVLPGENGKEIGWSALEPATAESRSGALAALFRPGISVLHWHGDTFELPDHVRHLASSAQYPNQAFAVDNFALALQFHPEVRLAQLERWYIGHACELAQAKIPIAELREAGLKHATALEQAAAPFWKAWLDSI